MQSKPIRNKDFDEITAKHVTFYNENFKRGRCDLLKKIQRSTRGGGSTNAADQAKEISALRDQVSTLEQKLEDVEAKTEERVRRLELDMLARMEQMMLAVQQQQRTQLQLEKATSVGTMNSSSQSSASNPNTQQQQQMAGYQQASPGITWDPSQFSYPRGNSVSSAVNSVANALGTAGRFQQPNSVNSAALPPTLPPHPKQKQLPMGIGGDMSGAMPAPPDRMNSLRGISTLSRGVSGLTRGASEQSSASAVLMRNSWEDKFFSMLMLDGNEQQQQQQQGVAGGGTNERTAGNLSPTPINENATATTTGAPVTVSQDSTAERLKTMSESDDLSDVSSPDLP